MFGLNTNTHKNLLRRLSIFSLPTQRGRKLEQYSKYN